jgi:ADP-ribose pyrophosphatase YjhB (NUDIX family)
MSSLLAVNENNAAAGSAEPELTHAFSLAVVERSNGGSEREYILVHEKANRGWWLPGGGIDEGETAEEAALRECVEEAGAKISVDGILRVETNPNRMRVIYRAHLKEPGMPLKSIPDKESKGAIWATASLAEALQRRELNMEDNWLRGKEPKWWFRYLSDGHRVAPLGFLNSSKIGTPPENPKSKCGSLMAKLIRVVVLNDSACPTMCMLTKFESEGKWKVPGGSFSSEYERRGYFSRANAFESRARELVGKDFGLVGILGVDHYVKCGANDTDKQTAMLRVCYLAAPIKSGDSKGVFENEYHWRLVDEIVKGKNANICEDNLAGFPRMDLSLYLKRAIEGEVQPLSMVAMEHVKPPMLRKRRKEGDTLKRAQVYD